MRDKCKYIKIRQGVLKELNKARVVDHMYLNSLYGSQYIVLKSKQFECS